MSGIWGWFGGGSAAQKRKDSPKNAILGLRTQLDMLQKRERHLQNQIDEQDAIARKNVSTNKTAAKQALRRKKVAESTLETTLGQITTLEQQINAIESANINRETLAAMQAAREAMGKIHGKLTPEKVDEEMAKLQEANDLSNEIATAITSANIGQPIDEGELEDELEKLQQEEVDTKLHETGGSIPVHDKISLPAAGTGALKGKEKAKAVVEDDEEEELRKLQAEMAM
ncbi:Snf7 domain-containing protein [Neurospora intermedia]|uniref:Vacuolar-sorting protein SNF7 n=1 Tax=Neurospora intermedia TaxID=5142 RepID=A0ABR3CZ44_NEUIN